MSHTPPIKILIADDHFVVREGLRSIIQQELDMEVVGDAVNGVKAVEAFELCHPDVTIMDLRMPLCNGVEAIRLIRRKYPEARVLVLSSYESDEEIYSAIKAGAMGYLLKHSSSEQILPAIHALMEGKPWIPAEVASHLVARESQESLTAREREIINLLACGHANKQIAEAFKITEGTVKSHMKNILAKLDVPDRTAAVTLALRRGIIHLPEG